jgi:anthranilate phosphoribosyltransferase
MMNNALPDREDPSIPESLSQLAIQLGQPLDRPTIEQIYHQAQDLLSHISPTAVTLARVAGVLLVYRIQNPAAEELQWFNAQIQQCTDEEEVEESIESLHRVDGL